MKLFSKESKLLLRLSDYFWFIDSSYAIDEGIFSPRDPVTTIRDAISSLNQTAGAVYPDMFGANTPRSEWKSMPACEICHVKYSLVNREHHCR